MSNQNLDYCFQKKISSNYNYNKLYIFRRYQAYIIAFSSSPGLCISTAAVSGLCALVGSA